MVTETLLLPEIEEIEESEPKTYTLEEFMVLPNNGTNYELVKGELVEMAQPGFSHGIIANKIGKFLGNFVDQNRLGMITNGSGYIISNANPKKPTVRGPDVAFVSAERLTELSYDPYKPFPAPPDLAIEVVSPTDIWYEVDDKVDEYLEAGVRLVWVVYPRRQSIFVYRSERPLTMLLDPQAELDGEDVIPGFKLKVSALFE